MWPSKDEIEEYKREHAFSRGFILGCFTGLVIAALVLIPDARYEGSTPSLPTSQQFGPTVN